MAIEHYAVRTKDAGEPGDQHNDKQDGEDRGGEAPQQASERSGVPAHARHATVQIRSGATTAPVLPCRKLNQFRELRGQGRGIPRVIKILCLLI
jgi:hypothetical protein